MKYMLKNSLHIYIKECCVICGTRKPKLVSENLLLRHNWNVQDMDFFLYTESVLRLLHHNFGNPSVPALCNLLQRENKNIFSAGTKYCLRKLQESCRTYQKEQTKQRRLKITIGSDDLRYNHKVQVDTIFLSGRPVIHKVDEDKHFEEEKLLSNKSTKHIWKAILDLWYLLFMGPPDYLEVDQGSNSVSREMKENSEAAAIKIREALVV